MGLVVCGSVRMGVHTEEVSGGGGGGGLGAGGPQLHLFGDLQNKHDVRALARVGLDAHADQVSQLWMTQEAFSLFIVQNITDH